MPCTKEQLVLAVNSYAAARVSNDATLIQVAAQILSGVVDTLEFAEPEAEEDGGQE
jgi:hypothetical protein